MLLCSLSCSDQPRYAELIGKQWPNPPSQPLFFTGAQNKRPADNGWRLINLWATWCEPCRKEMPLLQELANQVKPTNLSIQLISVDIDLNLVKEFVLQYDISLPIFISPQEVIEQSLDNAAYPATYLVSPNGKIVKVYLGAREWSSEQMVTELQNIMRSES
ncbi:TlpA disulfide reductase family protein [Thalassotalea sp. G2M2-11]|uniref:TlpA disulfide reductase family protein n=1 Tax=Thalassotalea sp. G2M2-11 TaxID=2787627 RepID=UPI0019D17D8B|nr:TlpA disulfide reductase family protein [Thalassotalea sp. G2M2-11]